MLQHEKLWKYTEEETATKGHIVYNPVYTKCPEQAHPHRQEGDQRLTESGGDDCLMDMRCFGEWWNVKYNCVGWLYDSEYTKNYWTVHFKQVNFTAWYISCVSKPLTNNRESDRVLPSAWARERLWWPNVPDTQQEDKLGHRHVRGCLFSQHRMAHPHADSKCFYTILCSCWTCVCGQLI